MLLYGYIFSFIYLFLIFAFAKLVNYRTKGIYDELSRKIVHILTGGLLPVFMYIFEFSFRTLFFCVFILIAIYFIEKHSAISFLKNNEHSSHGVFYFALSMTMLCGLVCVFDNLVYPFCFAVLCTALGDAFAGIIGSLMKKFNLVLVGNKTIIGSLSCFLISFFALLIFKLSVGVDVSYLNLFIIAYIATFFELVTPCRADNLTVPISVFYFTYIIMSDSLRSFSVVFFIILSFIAIVVIKAGLLTQAATTFAIFLVFFVFECGGAYSVLALVVFYVGAVIADKIKEIEKKKIENNILKKNTHRDFWQVVANGLVPMLCIFFYRVSGNHCFIVSYTGTLAAMFADTVASEIGVLSRIPPIDIIMRNRITAGLSGGISLVGCLAAICASCIMTLFYLVFYQGFYFSAFIVFMCGMTGMFVDSILGSLIQVKYRCTKCGIITEKEVHCDVQTVYESGVRVVNNDVVNLSCSVITAMLGAILYLLWVSFIV